jgi:hypothetical protein
MSQNGNSARVLQTKCILVGGPLTVAKVPRGVAFVCILCDWKKRLSIMLLMVRGHIPIMPYKKGV